MRAWRRFVFSRRMGRLACGVEVVRGEELRAEAVVLATNYHAVQRWVSEGGCVSAEVLAADGRFAGLGEAGERADIGGAYVV